MKVKTWMLIAGAAGVVALIWWFRSRATAAPAPTVYTPVSTPLDLSPFASGGGFGFNDFSSTRSGIGHFVTTGATSF